MAKEYADKGVSFVFVYTREAHPGENYPAHRSIEQKMDHAMAFKQVMGIERAILVDDLVGTGHHKYGVVPNSTYLIGRGGQVLFRADWTDPPTIDNALKYVLDARQQRRDGMRLAPFYAEMVGYRWSDHAKAREVLARAGQQAVDESEQAARRRAQQPPGPGRIALDS